MKVVKPQRLGLLTRVFENDGQAYLVITALGFFPFGAPKKLLHEVALWGMAAEQMGPGGVLDVGMSKHRGEVLVSGKAFAKDGVATPATSVVVRIASVDKELVVVGDRFWETNGPSEPVPFVEMPVTWERAFGGEGFPENPTGLGAKPTLAGGRKTHPLPNIESPKSRVRSPSDRPAPAGLSPIDQTWPQRMRHSGTYDQEWLRTRYPGFPKDMSWELYNTAPEDQRIQGYFRLDEPFRIEGMHPGKRAVESTLPGVAARLFVTFRGREGELREAISRLDTVHLFPNIERGVVIFRGVLPIDEDDAADVAEVIAAFEDPKSARSVDHYRAVRDSRMDRKYGALQLLIDDDLMPPWKEPEEAMPEDRWNDVEAIAASEGLQAAYARRKADRHLAEARAQWIARGMDPADFDRRIQRPKEPPKDLSKLPAYVEEMEKEKDLLVAQAKTQKEEAMASARERCAALGLDFDRLVEQRKAESTGPPKFSADTEMGKLRDRAQLFRNAGRPAAELEALLADPRFEERLRDVESKLRDAYRRGGHLFPAAGARDAEASAAVRELVQSARASGESLANTDFTGADLSGTDLSGLDLSGAFLESANLAGAVLENANLANAMLARAGLRGARLVGASFRGANLGQADLRGADLERGNLTEAVLHEADLRGARLRKAKLDGTMLFGAKLEGLDLGGVETHHLVIIDANISGARFEEASLEDCLFLRCDLREADFSGARLPKTSFVECVCDGATFAGAALAGTRFVKDTSLAGCNFKGARMNRTLLRGCDLRGADLADVDAPDCDFSEADLSGARLARLSAPRSLFVRSNLAGADSTGANLMLAILQKARLHGADLRGANLFRADLAKARGDKGTRLDGALTTQVRTVPEKGQTRILP